MVFSSIFFICVFLPIMLIGYYILPQKAKNIWLLIGSLVFYAWGGVKHLIFLISSIVINFLASLLIAGNCDRTCKSDERGNSTHHSSIQKTIFIITVILNIGSLVYFKYASMLVETVKDLFAPGLNIPQIILPLGISFYTFQCISYVTDVYRREGAVDENGVSNQFATHSFVDFALYITMFPQLLQGPIIRYDDVREALCSPKVNLSDFVYGLQRFILGLSKKAIIANTLGEVADNIFACDTSMMGTSVAWLGAILYTLQIYFDFSGYSDMAVGLGKLFGFTFMENFDYPYISQSITEFWRRWHISLSRWFRDYLYIPLGGNRKGNVYINLLIVFLATGIWHGAAWGFLIWGLWHGIFMLIERFFKTKSLGFRVPAFIKWLYTMLVVTLGWVLFKLEVLEDALDYIGVMFHTKTHVYNAFSIRYYLDKRLMFFLIIAAIACVPWAQVLPRYVAAYIAEFSTSKKTGYRIARYVCLGILLIVSMIFMVNSTYSPFIYFQF